MTDQAIATLQRQFGNNLARDVLESVLAIHDGDVQLTIQFLQAQGGDFIEQEGNLENRLPANYMQKPNNFSLHKLQSVTPKASDAMKLKEFILSENNKYSNHVEKQNQQRELYISIILILLKQNIILASSIKIKILVAAFLRKDIEFAHYLLSERKHFTFTEVSRTIKILDSPRKVKEITKKMERLRAGRSKPITITNLSAKLNAILVECEDLQRIKTNFGISASVNRGLCTLMKDWVSYYTSEELIFFALQMPKEPWRELSDIIHFAPTDFKLPWFLPFIYNSLPPNNSIISDCVSYFQNQAQADNRSELLDKLLEKHTIPYSYIRTNISFPLSLDAKKRIVSYETLDTIVWYYEELGGNLEIDTIIDRRLEEGEEPKFSYGKFMERLLYFKLNGVSFYEKLIPIAEKRLKEINLPLEAPVVVLGDASYSMDVAIRTSTIIASLLTAICSADLRFFNVVSYPPQYVPTTVSQVLHVASTTQADGLTAPACTIWEFYQKKIQVKCFIMVTDEIENESFQGQHFFAQLFYQYYTEVYPAKLVFASFLDNPQQKGRMVSALESFNIIPLQFRFDGKRPDLTRLDTMFAILATETSGFSLLSQQFANLVKATNFSNVCNNFQEHNSRLLQEINPRVERAPAKEEKEVKKEIIDDIVERDDGTCGLCLDAQADTALIECGHLLCAQCAVPLKQCPFCRQRIVRTLKIFRP